VGRRATFGALICLLALLVGATAAFADAPDPTSIHSSVSFDENGFPVLTVQGDWAWTTHHKDCNKDRWGAGWAVDWNDPSAPGNHVTTLNGQSIDVGTPDDNAVHHAAAPPRCGTFNGSYNTGTWGPITHVFPKGTTDFNVCVVTYDLHGKSTDPLPSGSDLVAGGSHHNGDNSAEKNKSTPGGLQCLADHTEVPVGTIGIVGAAALAALALGFFQVRSVRRRRKAPVAA
jgi:hypothetical protein